MSDVNISKFRAQVIRTGSTPASPGFAVAEGQNPVDPSGSGQTHLPVTIATVSTGLSITESQILSGAGLVSQYIRGDGSLADFPATTGGGSSVSYYLNGSVSQGTIGGVAYKELNRTPVFGAGTDISISADGYIASFITDALDPNKLIIPAGNWNFETYFSASSNGGTPSFYVELYKYNGTTFTLIATSSSAPELIAFGTNLNPYYSTLAVPETVLALTDRLALRYYVTHSGRTITLHTENNHLCQVITTFTTGLTALNGLTSQVQYLTVGTSGTDFAISSVTDTHTFNLPTASATNRGALSSADWTTFNNKTSNLGTVTSVGLSSATSGVTIGSSPITTSGTITLAIATASGSQNGLLSSTDWTTFNGKQNALTNPVTGTGTTNYLPKFTGATTIGNSNLINDASGNLGLGVTPSAWNSAYKAFQFGTTGALFGESGDAANYFTTNTFIDSVGFKYITSDWALGYFQENGVHSWRNAPSGTAGNAISFTQAMTLTNGGNLLVGTTTDAGFKLDVNGTGRFSGALTLNNASIYTRVFSDILPANDAQGVIYVREGNVSGADGLRYASRTHLFQSHTGSNYLTLASTGAATFTQTGGSFLIDSNGQFISKQNLDVATAGGRFTGQSARGTMGYIQIDQVTTGADGGRITFLVSPSGSTSPAEAMRITSTGFTKSSNNGTYMSTGGFHELRTNLGNVISYHTNSSNDPYGHLIEFTAASPNNTTNYFLYCGDSTQGKFAVFSNGDVDSRTNSYGGWSDIKLKENIVDASPKLKDLLKVKIKNYNFIGDNKKQLGVIAQELEEIFPSLVTETPDFKEVEVPQLDNEGNEILNEKGEIITNKEKQFTGTTTKSVKYSIFVPMLIKAIQELKQEIDTLKS